MLYSVTSNKGLHLHIAFFRRKLFGRKRLRKSNKIKLSRNSFCLDMTVKNQNKTVSSYLTGNVVVRHNMLYRLWLPQHEDFCYAGRERFLYLESAQRDRTCAAHFGLTSRALQVAPHGSEASGRFINVKLTQ